MNGDSAQGSDNQRPEPPELAQLRGLADALPVAVAHIDAVQRFVFVNSAYTKLFGAQPAELLGRALAEVLVPENYPAIQPYVEATLRGQPSRFEAQIALREGGARDLDVTCVPEHRPDGTIAGCFVSMIDVTGHRSTERALRESEALFREMTDSLPLIVWVHDETGAQEFVNGTFCEFFGVTREEMRGGRWQMLMHPEDGPPYLAEFVACVRERREFHHAVRVRRSDGAWRWIESWARPRFTSTGEFRGFVGTSADITERMQADERLRRSAEALRDSEERFRQLADAMPQLVWVAGDDGSVTYFNSRLDQFRGATRNESGQYRWGPALHPDDRANTEAAWRAAVEAGSTFQCEHRLCMADGSYRWHLSRAYRVGGQDRTARWFGTATDIHDVKRAQEALRESDRRKDDFLAMLGHELRNPLAAIRNATDLVKRAEAREPGLQRAYGVLERQTAHMTRLVDDLLEMSRVARDKIQLNLSTFDLREVIVAVLQDRAPEIARNNLVVRSGNAPEALWVRGDLVRLGQVFDNLLGNAIKFTGRGGSINLELRSEGATAMVCMEDTGKGIAPDFLPHIFEPFQQEGDDMARASGGLGLGLALAKRLVDLHGGTIEARSGGRGRGAAFCVRIPLSAAPEQVRPTVFTPEPSAGRRILVVEDNADVAEMLRELLVDQGHAVCVAGSGTAALEQLRRQGADVAICDLGLPDMNGYELGRAIRADESLRHVVLIALTGYGQPEDRKRTREAGFDQHLVKPVSPDVLDSALRKVTVKRD